MVKSPYLVLGLPEGAEMQEVKKAYRRLAKETHPDLGGDGERFKEINDAYTAIEKGTYVPVRPKRGHLTHETLFTYSCI